MEKSTLLQSFYIIWITFLVHLQLGQSRIFKYEDEDNEYIQVFDRAKMKEDIYGRQRRSTFYEEKRKRPTSKEPSLYRNISSFHIFKEDSNNVAFVFWKHAKTTVIFILTCQQSNTTNYNKHSNKGCKSKSKFYRSSNYGRSFQPITQGIQHAHLHSIYLSPINKQFIVLTDYKNKTLYLTNDEGNTFKKYNVSFRPTFIYFHPVRETYIAAYDNTLEGNNSLYVSENRGINWVRVSTKVRNYFWARKKYDDDDRILYIEKETEKKIDSKTTSSFLFLTKPPYTSIRSIYNQHLVPYSVFVGEAFIITQRLYDRHLYISARKSKTFSMATFDKLSKKALMYVVVSDENNEILLTLVHSQLQASLYLSDSSGTKFRMRQRHIQTEMIKSQVVPPKMDLYVVKGVFGTYIVNRRGSGSSITFDKGYTWRDIQVDNERANRGISNPHCGKKCDVKLYLKIEHPFFDFTAPIISKTNAPGIIIAQGHIGKYRTPIMKHFVFISVDGGYTWKQTLSTTHGYVILDHGGLIAATPLRDTPIRESPWQAKAEVVYSTDYGKTWFSIHLTKLYSRIAAIITESTASLLVMNVFGFLHPDKQGGTKGNTWIVWQFNFTKVLRSSCSDTDFNSWPHNNDACVMGEKTSNLRRNPRTKCISGPQFDNKVTRSPCLCSYKDYSCENDYYRKAINNQSRCIPINPKHKPIKICENSDFYIKSSGYRKLYGNKCKEGVEEKLIPVKVKCTVLKPGWIKIKASSTIVGVNQPVTFGIVQVVGFYNATYTWSFNDSNAQELHGAYSLMKTVTHRFLSSGKYVVGLRTSNSAGYSHASIEVTVLDILHLEAHIMYDHPLIVNTPKQFSLKTFTPNGTLVMIEPLPSTKFMWSFDGIYSAKHRSIVTEHTFQKSGIVNVEVQVMNPVSSEVYRERVSVYVDAEVIDIYFSPRLDEINEKTETWIVDFETKYKIFLDTKYELVEGDISDRVLVRGRAGIPTKLSIIIYETKDSIKTLKSASAIAKRICDDINNNKPLVKGYERENIRVVNAKMSRSSKLSRDKPSKYAWVYIIVAMIIIATIISLTAYYRYRRKHSLWCVFIRDHMDKHLIDEEELDVDTEHSENYNHL